MGVDEPSEDRDHQCRDAEHAADVPHEEAAVRGSFLGGLAVVGTGHVGLLRERMLECAGVGGEAAIGQCPEREDHRDQEGHGDEDVHAENPDGLLCAGPDECRGGGYRAHTDHRLRDDGRRDEDGEADHHADGREAKAVVPAVGLADVAAEQRGHGRTEVHAHVEDGEAAIPLGFEALI